MGEDTETTRVEEGEDTETTRVEEGEDTETTRVEEAPPAPTGGRLESSRAEARKRIERRRNLQGGLVAYVVVNAFLVLVWATTGRGYFWPGWVLGAWGVGMVLGLWDYLRRPVSEADVENEIERMRSKRR